MCAPTSTTSSPHCTSPSTSCWAHATDQASRPSLPTPNWSAWPSPRPCSAPTPNATGCAFARTRLGHLFPYLPQQAGYNNRLRAAAHLVGLAIRLLAQHSPSWGDGFRLLDATPLPCGASRETVKRSALWGHAAYGYDRSHSRWYWVFKLYLLTAPAGMPITWCLATPKLGEREVAEALLDDAARQAALAAGTIILADKGFCGRAFQAHVRGLGAGMVRPDRSDEPVRFGSVGGVRQWIEAIIWTLKDQLGLERHRGRTLAGVFVRVGQRLLALAAAVWFNWQQDVPAKRSLIAYNSQ
jgi:Transposase DDE domain